MSDKKNFSEVKTKMNSIKGNALDKIKRLSNKQKVAIAGASFILVAGAIIIPATASKCPADETLPVAEAPAESKTIENIVPAVDAEAVRAIAVDGKKIVYLKSEEDAQAVLDGIIAGYTEEGSEIVSATFKENVEIVSADDYISAERAAEDKTVTETYLCEPYEAIAYIVNGTSTPKKYVVQSGDTLWDIAYANNLSPYELEAMNPSIDVERLNIGDEVNLYEVNPFVTVTTVEVATETETIPYSVEYTPTADLYKGQTQVTSAGTNGSKEKKVEYVRENGVLVATNLVSESITLQPVTQYALSGTTTMPIKTGSGALQSPVGTTALSSAAGAYGVSRGNRVHAGMDLKGSTGDPIYAADGGTVIFSGYSGDYGNLITIDHGNGIQTKYSHCDTLLVSYGDNVEKGQQIATVGETGNARGAHLHFEVRVDGRTVNPANYI